MLWCDISGCHESFKKRRCCHGGTVPACHAGVTGRFSSQGLTAAGEEGSFARFHLKKMWEIKRLLIDFTPNSVELKQMIHSSIRRQKNRQKLLI